MDIIDLRMVGKADRKLCRGKSVLKMEKRLRRHCSCFILSQISNLLILDVIEGIRE